MADTVIRHGDLGASGSKDKGPSKVWFASARVRKWTHEDSLPGKLERLLKEAALGLMIEAGEEVAVKTHFGSHGAHRIIRPVFLRKVTDAVREAGGKPFVTDTVRIKGLDYLELAKSNGSNHLSAGAPVFLADRAFGNDNILLKAPEPLGEVAVATGIHDAPAMVMVSHVKGHINSGYAGAIKNLAMGGVSGSHRSCGWKCGRGSMHMIGAGEFQWDSESCDLCGQCEEVCPLECISFPGKTFDFNDEKCWRCGRCVRVCPTGALRHEGTDDETFMKGLAAASSTVLSTFGHGKVLYLNFMLEIQPECDCMPGADVPVMQDLGIMMSYDPVAVEQACMDMLAKAEPLPGSAASDMKITPGQDVLFALNQRPAGIQMEECERMGLGSRQYELIDISK